MGYGCVSEIFCTSSWSRGDTVDRRKDNWSNWMWQQSWQCLKTLSISKKKQEMLWQVAEKSREKLSE